jgi:hypothetical protein
MPRFTICERETGRFSRYTYYEYIADSREHAVELHENTDNVLTWWIDDEQFDVDVVELDSIEEIVDA